MVSPKVSVIIPFLNAKKYLKEAVESVFAQTYKDWELLLVDDGSTDNSMEIAIDYVKQYPEKVRYLCHKGHNNRGISSSRNLGNRHAQGEFIALLDSDDIYLPEKLEQQVSILDLHPEADALFGETQYWFSWTRDPRDFLCDYVSAPWKRLGIQPNTIVTPPRLLHPLLVYGVMPTICSLIMRHEVINRLGGWEDEFSGIYEDQVFFTKLFLKGSIIITPSYLEKY
jgi:glycosyltransferase involved in cell wall biosynthesis